MSATLRRVAPLLLIAALTGCSATVPPSPRTVAPSLSPVPGGPSQTPSETLPPTSDPESNRAIGPIWDALPPSWPELPGQTESEVGTDASTMLVVKGAPKTLAEQLRLALTSRGWAVDVGTPLEDGSVVLDATHDPAGCRAEARFTPDQLGADTGVLLVYYGARCPFG